MYSNGGLFTRRRPPPPKHQQRIVWMGITVLTSIGLLLYLRHVITRLFAARDTLGLRGPGPESLNPDLDAGYDDAKPADYAPSGVDDGKDGDEGDVTEFNAMTEEELEAYEAELMRQAKEAGLDDIENANGPADEQMVPAASEEHDAAAKAQPKPAAKPVPAVVNEQKPAVDAAKIVKAAPRQSAAAAVDAQTKDEARPQPIRHKALIFTMDGISDYVQNSKAGGPAGEIIVRESLEWGLRQLGVEAVVASSDAEFARLSAKPDDYSLYFLDPWTFVDPGA